RKSCTTSCCWCERAPSSFFFQAEDGIRALYVTGVQTCALPISRRRASRSRACRSESSSRLRDARPGTRGNSRDSSCATTGDGRQIGRASCRERVEIWGVVGAVQKKNEHRLAKGREENGRVTCRG